MFTDLTIRSWFKVSKTDLKDTNSWDHWSRLDYWYIEKTQVNQTIMQDFGINNKQETSDQYGTVINIFTSSSAISSMSLKYDKLRVSMYLGLFSADNSWLCN